jgi:hypothetical protein
MPIQKWNDIYKTGDLRHVLKFYKPFEVDFEPYWHALNDEFIEIFGLKPSFLERLKTKKKLISLIDRFLRTKDRLLLNEIEIMQNSLMKVNEKDEGIEDVLSALEKHYNTGFDSNMSVYDFFRRINYLQNGAN